MARRPSNRRRFVTTVNTAIATAAVTATAAGWAAFGITDTSSTDAPQTEQAATQLQAGIDQERAEELRHLVKPKWWQVSFSGASRAVAMSRSSR